MRGGFLAGGGRASPGAGFLPKTTAGPDTLGHPSPILPRHLERAKIGEEWKNPKALVNPLPPQLLCAQELSRLPVVASFLTERAVAGLPPGSLAQPELISPWFAEQR